MGGIDWEKEIEGVVGQVRELDGAINEVQGNLNQLVTRKAELIGVLKYLKEKENAERDETKEKNT